MPVYANKGSLDVHKGSMSMLPVSSLQKKIKGIGIDFPDAERSHPVQGSDYMRCLGLFQVAVQVDPV
jgi:hypothetical protein